MMLFLINIYRFYLAPFIKGVSQSFLGYPADCPYTPSCSDYATEAVQKLGWFRGSVLALRRIGRCHPGCPGGWDPVKED